MENILTEMKTNGLKRYAITHLDLGRRIDFDNFGIVATSDIGKLLVINNNVLQMENKAQFDARQRRNVMSLAKNISDSASLKSLERKCLGESLVNAVSKLVLADIYYTLKQFEGKKIKLASGDKSKEFNEKLSFEKNHYFEYIERLGFQHQVWFKTEYNYLVLMNQITLADKRFESGGYGVSYYKNEIYFNLDDRCLKPLASFADIVKERSLNEVYTASDIQQQLDEKRRLEEEARNIGYKIRKFV